MKKSKDASLVFTSSGVGRRGKAFWGAYSVSKFGVEALNEILADEFEELENFRTNAVNPGPIRTAMRAAAYPDEDPETLPRPDEVTDVFVYLASDGSAEVSGERFRAKEFEIAVR